MGHANWAAYFFSRSIWSLGTIVMQSHGQTWAQRVQPMQRTRSIEQFCMTILALRMSAHSNGVSKLHGQVTRDMWQQLWPDVPRDEIPIRHVTNGVHCQTWASHEMDQLYDRYLGPRWREEPADAALWKAIDRVPAEELWRTHERRYMERPRRSA